MTVDNSRYSLTLSSIKAAIDSFKDEGGPLFRVQSNPDPNVLDRKVRESRAASKNNQNSPVIDKKAFEGLLDECFSRGASRTLTQQNLLFFLLGGYAGFIRLEPSRLSYLFSGNRRASGDAEIFERDLARWKCTPAPDGTWIFKDYKDGPVPSGAISLFRYMVERNEYIIRKYSDSNSQKGLRNLLINFSKNIYGAEQATPEKISPMDPDYVEQLSKHLYMLARLAEIFIIDGKQPRYLAEGLTWLITASLLRGKFPADSEEFYCSQRDICRATDEAGIVETVEVRGGWKITSNDPSRELYDRLMERFRYTRGQHPSIRMMEPDPDLFPKGLPAISNADRTVAEEKAVPISIKDMVLKGWEEHKHLLLVGKGGIGKTVCMLTLPEEEWVKDLLIPAVYIPLQSLDIYEGNLTSYIKDSYGSNAERITDLTGVPWDGHPQLLLLLDGFNEIPMEYRLAAERHIRIWMDRPGVQVITTSRISFSLNGRFLEYKLKPLPKETVRAFLLRTGLHETDLPDAIDPLWKVISIPLMLTMFVQVDKVREIADGSDVSALLDWKGSDNAAHIIWNYLQVELYRLMSADRPVMSAAAILAIAPFVCFEMAKSGKFYIEQEDFRAVLNKAVQFYSQHEKLLPEQVVKIRYKYDKFRKEKLLDDATCEGYFSILSEQSVLFQGKENSSSSGKYEIVYVPTHQNFRDSLAAVFISGCMLNSVNEELPFPEEILAAADFCVKNYIAEYLTDDELINIWDYHRTTEPENGRVTWILMDLIGRQRDYDYRALDFSGLDLTDINLHRLLSRRLDICPLPRNAELFKNTKMSLKALTPKGHLDSATCVAFSPDGGMLASGSWDDTVCVWDLANGQCRTLKGHSSSIYGVSFSPDGKLLASCSLDDTVCVWDLANGQCRTLKGHSSSVYGVSFSPDGKLLASCSLDDTVRVWDLIGNQCHVLEVFSRTVCSVSFSPNSRMLAGGSVDNTVLVWDLVGSQQRILKGHSGTVNSVCFSPDGRALASGSKDHTVRVWDLVDGQQRILEEHSDSVNSVSFSPDGRMLASASDDHTVRVWDLVDGQQRILEEHSGSVNSVSFSPNGRLLASASDDHTVRVWDLVNGQHQVLEIYSGSVSSVSFSPDSKMLASASGDHTVRVWDLVNGQHKVFQGHSDPVSSVSFSPDGRMLASASDDHTVRVWDLVDGQHKVFQGHSGSVNSISFSPDGKMLASASWDDTVRVWDLANSQCHTLKGHSSSVYSVSFSPDGRLLASCSSDDTIRVWNLVDSQCHVLEGFFLSVNNVSFSPNGRMLASASDDHTVRIWDLVDGQQRVLGGHSGPVISISFRSDSRMLASGCWDNTVHVWDLMGVGHRILKGHSDSVLSVSFSPDGKFLASSSYDGTVRIWDLISLKTIKVIRIISGINFCSANFEKAIIPEDDKVLLSEAGAKI